MNRWAGLLRFAFAFVIVSLAGLIAIIVRAIFHSQTDGVTGITFLVAVVSICLIFERAFPSVYSRRRPRKWWQTRMLIGLPVAIVISVLSSRIATLWFGLVIVSGVIVAI